MRAAALMTLLILIIVAAGCLNRLSGGASDFAQDYADDMARVAITHPNQTEACQMGTCWCMVCRNGTSLFGPMRNLIGGHCVFDQDCTPQDISDYGNATRNPDLRMREFMIGQGPTFGDFGRANTYCNQRLRLAVQWLVGSNDSAYLLPDAQRTMCFLSKDVIPMFVLYSNGTAINESRSRQIGRILGTDGDDLWLGRLSDGPVGPVIVVTEIDFDRSKATQVAEQVRWIDSECNKERPNKVHCFIAVAPKINDFAALDAVMQALGPDRDRVDLVAFGINGKYLTSCDGSRAQRQALNFSSYALYNWSKPTIIPYVLFDPGSNDSNNSCTWTEAGVVSAYSSLIPFGIEALQGRGVIGIAPYSLYARGGEGGVTNPLNCTDCGLNRSQSRLNAWYSGCQSYTAVSALGRRNPSASTHILFGNASGTVCNQNAQFDWARGFSFAGRDIMQPEVGNMGNLTNLTFTCDACLISNVTRSATDMFPSLRVAAGQPPELYCKGFPEIEQWASARNIDPMLVRAFTLTESGFDPCAAAKVCNQGYDGAGCFQPGPGKDECYDKAYDEMYDPAGNCTFANAGVPPGSSQLPDWRWCAVGIMQSLEPPYTFWPSNYHPDGVDGPYLDIFQRSGFYSATPINDQDFYIPMLNPARACNPRFNPFVAADSICIGTYKMERMLAAARYWVSSHQAFLNWNVGTTGDFDKTNLFVAYVAGNMYAGFWGSKYRVPYQGRSHPRCSSGVTNGDCWAYGFQQSMVYNTTYCSSDDGQADSEHCSGGRPRQEPPFYCYGYSDFMQYVNDCELPFLPRQADPGRNKVQAYLWLNQNCPESMCPDGRALAAELCRDDGSGQYNPDLCAAPGVPRPPASGTYYVPDTPAPSLPGIPGTPP